MVSCGIADAKLCTWHLARRLSTAAFLIVIPIFHLIFDGQEQNLNLEQVLHFQKT